MYIYHIWNECGSLCCDKTQKNIKNLLWPNCWVPQFYIFLNLFMSTVTKVLQDPTENVALHCKVQEYLIGQGKGRNDNTINNAWYSSKNHWDFVSRGLSVWKVYIWPNKPQALGMILLQILFFFFFSVLPLQNSVLCLYRCISDTLIPPESKTFR